MLNPESYLSLEEADTYHQHRISAEAWNGLDDDTKRRRLLTASDFLDAYYRFSGEKTDPEQPRQFPRNGSQSIPAAVKAAVCELALQEDLNQNAAQTMQSVKVGPLSVNYAEARPAAFHRFEYVKTLLNGLLTGISGNTPLLRG